MKRGSTHIKKTALIRELPREKTGPSVYNPKGEIDRTGSQQREEQERRDSTPISTSLTACFLREPDVLWRGPKLRTDL